MTPVALITGSNGGIGQSLVMAFRKAGYRTIGIDRSLTDTCDIAHDLACLDEQALLRDIRRMSEDPVSVLINNAALQIVAPFADTQAAAWREVMEINLIAPARLTRLLLDDLKAERGSVINIGSIHARLTKPGFTAYATSKAALAGFTRSLAVEVGSDVRINAIEPAAIDTPMLRDGFRTAPQMLQALHVHHPAARIGTPQEVAELALFLASDQANFVNGATISMDGGIGGRLHDPV